MAIRRVSVIPQRQRVEIADLLQAFPNRRIVACDFLVEGMLQGEEVPGGYELEGVLNVDHHAPVRCMERHFSSVHLAMAQVHSHGPAEAKAAVVINHVDADSVLSSLIMAGLLQPHPFWGEAGLAADHTGQEHPVADLLQALQSRRDLHLSTRSLGHLLRGLPLEPAALGDLAKRRSDRERAEALVREGQVHWSGKVAYARIQTKLDAGLLPPLLPEAWVILTFSPMKDREGHLEVKVRQGLAAPEGLSLQRLGIETFDPAYGGRWNAGSNIRGGGTPLSPETYAERVADLLSDWNPADMDE
jgi:hypothetical protein